MSDIKNVIIIGDIFNYNNIPDWVDLLKSAYDWNIINLACVGVGSSYNITKFLKNKEDFDLCIFIWGDVYRILHHDNLRDKDIHNAADLFYTHLVNNPITYIEHIALLQGFDTYLKQQYNNKLFWHFYLDTTGEVSDPNLLFYNFTQGITIYPTLNEINTMSSDYVHNKLKNILDNDCASGVFILKK